MRLSRFAWAVVFVGLVGTCAKPVPQDQSSGSDYEPDGAEEIDLDDDGEGWGEGDVAYRKGDRIDWWMVELPEGRIGRLELQLRFTPLERGLDLAFDVYDQWFHRVDRAPPRPDTGTRKKKVELTDATGTYYIQVYAPRRIDAGSYELRVDFRGRPKVDRTTDWEKAWKQIDDPPKLPAVPEPDEDDDDDDDDDDEVVDAGVPDAEMDAAPALVYGRISQPQLSGRGLEIVINRGSRAGVDRGWHGVVLRGQSDRAVPGSAFTVHKVTGGESRAYVRLTVDQVRDNRRVKLSSEPLED